MRALCAELGDPQGSWQSLHVVGTNGKSSVTLIAAALLEGRGRRTGSAISPHLERWSERTRIAGAEIGARPFTEATERVAAAVLRVEERLGERITQFEAAIAVSFVAFREAGVEAAVVEAGLGGRLDATNVIPSRATALTTVALDHTEWLGGTIEEIAGEKLAVLRPGTALVLGSVVPAIARLAAATARERGAELIEAGEIADGALPGRLAPYLRRNAAVALALARRLEPAIGPDELGPAIERAGLRGRAEHVPGSPPLLLDVAHNAEGATALAEALAALPATLPAFGCVALLADKDADSIAVALGPALRAVVCTGAAPRTGVGRPGAEARGPERVAAAFRRAGCVAEVEEDPVAAVGRAFDLAEAAGGLAVCAGSHYLLEHAWTAKRARSSSR